MGVRLIVSILTVSLFSSGDLLCAESPLDVVLETLAGETVSLEDALATDYAAVVFLATECPVANRYAPELNAIAAEVAGAATTLVGVYCDPNEKLAALREHQAEYAIRFPVYFDRDQKLVAVLGATFTPQVVVFDRKGNLFYRGRIDDRFVGIGKSRPAPVERDLREVLAALATGTEPPFREAAGFGCLIHQKVPAPE